MDLLHDNLGTLYRKYLTASFGSALISSIYGLVDMAMVGQYHGPTGSAAMAVIAPIWNILYSFGLLCGIGGSVLYAIARGKPGREREANGCFTASVLLGGLISAALIGLVWIWEVPLLRLFGADDALLPLCLAYLEAPKLTVPVYVFSNILSSFLRNDNDPGLATRAVVFGGLFNVFGDYFFVFVLDMGIRGAGIATAIGASASVLLMLGHFLRKSNTLRPVRPARLLHRFRDITVNGFSSFFSDVAMGILTMLFNRQIMKYLGTDALAIYGVIVSVSTFVQCCAYGVGQASQPLLSQNYGAGAMDRIRTLLRYGLVTSAVIGLVWTGLCEAFPTLLIRLYMAPTDSVLAAAPSVIRVYAISFLLLPLNIYASYYLQALARAAQSMLVSMARGMAVSGALILILPPLLDGSAVWWAMPVTEMTVFLASLAFTRRSLTSRPAKY